jgi:hypothetical protein
MRSIAPAETTNILTVASSDNENAEMEPTTDAELKKELSEEQKVRLAQQKERMAKKNEKRREKAMAKERKATLNERKQMERERKIEELRLERESQKKDPPKKVLELQRLAEEKELIAKEFIEVEHNKATMTVHHHKKKSMLESGRLGGLHMA